jgi:hypothetical protein
MHKERQANQDGVTFEAKGVREAVFLLMDPRLRLLLAEKGKASNYLLPFTFFRFSAASL